MKKLFLLVAVFLLFALTACMGNEETPDVVNFSVFAGPSAIGALELMDAAERDDSLNNYNVQILGAPTDVPPLLLQGLLDIAAVPTNLASVLYNQTEGDILLLAATTLGVLHIVDTTGSINSVADLQGHTIFLSGYGAAPHFSANFVLRQNGLEPGVDVFLEFRAEQAEIAALLAEGVAEVALLPEPFATTVTMQNEAAVHALDWSHEWDLVGDGSRMIMTALVARRSFAEAYPQAIRNFMQDFENSINFVNNNLEQAAGLAVDFGIIPNPVIAEAAIPRTNQVFLSGQGMHSYVLGYLEVLHNELPPFIGGALPSYDFFLTLTE